MPNDNENRQNPGLVDPENYGLPENFVPIDVPPIVPRNLPGGAGVQNPYLSGSIPLNMQFPEDLARTGSGPNIPTVRLMPVSSAGNPSANAAIKSVATPIITEIVNNSIAAIPPTTQVSDGLIHGETPWETDPAAIVLQDEFNSGTATSGQIGSLGWEFTQQEGGAGSGLYVYPGGGFPYTGEICVGASSTANSGYTLIPNFAAGSVAVSRARAPFVESPSWKMIWVFRFMPNIAGGISAGFDLTNRAMYIGLGIEVSSDNFITQRPFNFVGLRFDQDTTAPSIGDTTFKFESLQNGAVSSIYTRTSTNGVNNQGGASFGITSVSCTSNVVTVTAANTLQANSMVTFSNMTTSTFLNGVTANVVTASSTSFTINFTHANFSATSETGTATLGGSVTDTGITPVIGQYYRFEMSCSTVGQVSMSLSNGTTTFTATGIQVPQYAFNLVSTWDFANDFTGEFRVDNGPLVGPFGTGSVLTFSNFTSSAAVYNGSQALFDSDATVLHFLTSTSTGTLSNQTGTIAGYPSHFIQASFGTTTSGTGTAKCALHIDFFGFAWNPGVNGGTGTPNSVKPRYW